MNTIKFRNKLGEIIGETKVSDADYVELSKYSWSRDSRGYLKRSLKISGKRTSIAMHRAIMADQLRDGLVVDHINGDILDNRRENLRVVSHSANRENSVSRKGATSRFRGVSFHKGLKKWQVQFSLKGKSYYLGVYKTEEEAGQVAIAFIKENMPYYARGDTA